MSEAEGPRTAVAPEVLHRHLADPSWLVVDCRHNLADFTAGRRAYEAGHIPGAFFADVERDLAGEKTGTNGRHPMPAPETFAAFLRSLGADDRTQIVAYDEGADMYAARLWFLCKWIGHDAVAVLDGGLGLWRALGFPTTVAPSVPRAASGVERPARNPLAIRLHPEMVVSVNEVLASLDTKGMRLLDARAADRFRGEVEPLDKVAGHIPGAQNYWFKNNFDGNGRLKSPGALREAYERFGTPKAVVHQCGSGISSAVNLLAMERAGLHGSRIYAGSWSEWCSDPSRPVATGNDRSA